MWGIWSELYRAKRDELAWIATPSADGVASLARKVRGEWSEEHWTFGGQDARSRHRLGEASDEQLSKGRFGRELQQNGLLWRGSSKRTVHFLSDRYATQSVEPTPVCEVHIDDQGGSALTGFPPEWLLSELGQPTDSRD